tara:strand:- start:116 stop:466 length:351 start_codon:yes stop_codon:yes gene_type:complete
MNPQTLNEILVNIKYPQKWGSWYFTKKLTLDLKVKGNIVYWIDLKNIDSCAEMLDWIFQISCKSYTKGHIEDLIQALNDIFIPQANCCSSGKEKKFIGKKLAQEYKNQLKKQKELL